MQEASATSPAPGGSPRLSDRGLAVAFISPALLLLLGMSVFPLLWALYLSFTDYSATRDVPADFIGFRNYTDILTSSQVHQRALTTLLYVVGAVTLQTVLGFAIAYLISRRTHGRGLLTTLFLRQDELGASVDAVGIPTLTRALDGAAGADGDSGTEDSGLLAAVDAEYRRYFTATGRESSCRTA